MKQMIKGLQLSLLCMLCIVVPLFAQQPASTGSGAADQKQRAASAIYDDIMLTLPGDMKARVDSAAVSGKCTRPAPGSKSRAAGDLRTSNKSAAAQRDGAVGSLPEDVRGQVEKAITDIDLMNQNRQVQFKEYEKKRPGSR